MKNTVKLYNVLFPFWMLMLFPQMWLIVLPANFVIDSLVLLILMKVLSFSKKTKKRFFKRHILKIFGIGLVSDIAGSAYMFIMTMLGYVARGDELKITVPALLISAILIYVINFHVSFKNFDRKTRIKMSLTFAIATSPYTFLIPTSFLYNF